MQILYAAIFLLLVVGPMLLAWRTGDRILNGLAARTQHRRRQRRRRFTRALPVREDALQTLLDAEDLRDRIDARIGEALAGFHLLSAAPVAAPDPNATIGRTERALLTRESHFNTYLDLAWLQSETIEILTGEVELLREIAGLEPDHLRPASNALPAPPAAERLLQSLKSASERRAAVDRRLHRIGASGQAAAGSRFDTTVDG